MAGEAKVKEAQKHIAEAEKALKTSFVSLKFKPDVDSAADEYRSAAKCYKVARKYRESKDTYLKASELFESISGYFHAAQCLDEAILCCKDLGGKDLKEVPDHAEKMINLCINHGYHETGALNLNKAGDIVKAEMPDKAAKMFLRAGEVVSVQDNGAQIAAQYTSKGVRLLVTLKRYDEAAAALLQEFGYLQEAGNSISLGRDVIALMLVHLAREDVVAASKAYQVRINDYYF